MKQDSKTNVYVANSPKQGKGVFAIRDFKIGETILKIDDSHLVTDESTLTPEQHQYDLDYLDNKTILMQEPEKYINHSCDPNSYVKNRGGIRHVVAMRDINKDEEITYDYAIDGDNEGTFICNCRSKNCRGIYQGNFFKLPKGIQKRYLPYLSDWFIKKHKQKIEALKSNHH